MKLLNKLANKLQKLLNKLLKFTRSPDLFYDKDKSLKNLELRLSDIEKRQKELERLLNNKSWTIEKIIFERIYLDKIEFNFGSINIKDLNGLLNIGMNYGATLNREEISKNETRKPNTKKDGNKAKINIIYDK